MKSYIDLSGCSSKVLEKHNDFPCIPVRIGRHLKDIDVIMDEIPQHVAEKLKSDADSRFSGDGVLNKEWPVGFDLKSIPEGAVLHLVI